jgi:hypothetical protein
MPRVPINPDRIYRECDARDIFGYGPSQLRQKIKSGAIPKPVLLSAPPSRGRGWYGWMINDYREKLEKEQQAWATATTDVKGEAATKGLRYQPKGGDTRKAAPEKPEVKKLKGLKRPEKA